MVSKFQLVTNYTLHCQFSQTEGWRGGGGVPNTLAHVPRLKVSFTKA